MAGGLITSRTTGEFLAYLAALLCCRFVRLNLGNQPPFAIRPVKQRAVRDVIFIGKRPQSASANGGQPMDLIPVGAALPPFLDWPVGTGHLFSVRGKPRNLALQGHEASCLVIFEEVPLCGLP